MNIRIKAAAEKVTAPWVFAAALFFLIIQFLINGNLFGVAKLREITNGVSIPDLHLFGNSGELYTFLSSMGEAGRAYYKKIIIPLDFLFPFGYSFFLFTAMARSYRFVIPSHAFHPGFLTLPFLAAAADYMENISILFVIKQFPLVHNAFAAAVINLTRIKFLFLIFSYSFLGIGILAICIRVLFKKLHKEKKMDFRGAGSIIGPFAILLCTGAMVITFVFPSSFKLSIPPSVRWLTGALLFFGGAVFHYRTGFSMLKAFREYRLVTRGGFSISRNPMYGSFLFLMVPGLALLFSSWLFFLLIIPTTALVLALVPSEEEYLIDSFGREYQNYRSNKALLLPWII